MEDGGDGGELDGLEVLGIFLYDRGALQFRSSNSSNGRIYEKSRRRLLQFRVFRSWYYLIWSPYYFWTIIWSIFMNY